MVKVREHITVEGKDYGWVDDTKCINTSSKISSWIESHTKRMKEEDNKKEQARINLHKGIYI